MPTKIVGAIVGLGILAAVGVFFSQGASTEGEADTAKPGGCAIGSGQCQAGAGDKPEPPVASSLVSVESASDFTLEKLGGGTITLAEYRGKKPVIVDFWASWCPNCRRDMPKVNQWYQQYRDRVEVIGVNLQENPKTVAQFVESNNIIFPIALDPAGVASAQFGIQFTNTHFLFSKSGELVRVIPGDITEADIASLIES